jgi:sugar transferase (PEP-CTERM/EpsH1 system associated)
MHVVPSLQVGGLENGVVNLVNRMDPERFRHDVVCIGQAGPMASRIEQAGVSVHAIGKGQGSDYGLAVKLAQVMRQRRPDIVHTRNWGAVDGILAARMAGVPVVIHGEHGREAADPEGRNRRRNVARRLLGRWVDRFVVVSGDLARWLAEETGVPAGKVVQIKNGVDTEKFHPASDKSALREKLGIPPESFVVGAVGRLDPVKDYGTLIRAAGRAGLPVPNAVGTQAGDGMVLMIAGTGPCREELEQAARAEGLGERVRFLGERADVPDLMRAFDLFVLSSVGEGMSNTILEAMASGLPVVATRVGGNPELIEEDVTGTLVPPADPEKLAAAIRIYRDDPSCAREHGRAGRERAVEKFSLSRMVRAYEALYDGVLSGARTGAAR